MESSEKKYPKGHFMNLYLGWGIAICAGIGIPLSVITKNFAFIGLGPAIGVAVGAALGQSMENKYEQKGLIRPLSQEEIKLKKRSQRFSFILLLTGLLLFLLLIFF